MPVIYTRWLIYSIYSSHAHTVQIIMYTCVCSVIRLRSIAWKHGLETRLGRMEAKRPSLLPEQNIYYAVSILIHPASVATSIGRPVDYWLKASLSPASAKSLSLFLSLLISVFFYSFLLFGKCQVTRCHTIQELFKTKDSGLSNIRGPYFPSTFLR